MLLACWIELVFLVVFSFDDLVHHWGHCGPEERDFFWAVVLPLTKTTQRLNVFLVVQQIILRA